MIYWRYIDGIPIPPGIISAKFRAFITFINAAQTRRFMALILVALTVLI